MKSIIRARETKEEQLLAELGRLHRAVGEAERRLEEGLSAIRSHDGQPALGSTRSPWLGLAREYRRRLEREVYVASTELDERRRACEEARERAVEAGKERRAAEELLTRKRAAVAEEVRRVEASLMDELGQRARGLP